MFPYVTQRLSEYPDVADIKREGRKSIVGRVKRDRGYSRSAVKTRVRRSLKRADRAKTLKETLHNEMVNELDWMDYEMD